MTTGYIHIPEVKVIPWSLSKVTQNETGFQVSDTGPSVLWLLKGSQDLDIYKFDWLKLYDVIESLLNMLKSN